jgi:biotin carboxyl carrier protein
MYKIEVNNNLTVEIDSKLNSFSGTNEKIEFNKLSESCYEVIVDGKKHIAHLDNIDLEAKTISVKINQNKYTSKISTPANQLIEKLGIKINEPKKSNALKSPMPGLILKILVQENQPVKKGDALIILEAMKMENVFKAQNDSIIKSINVSEQNTVEKNQELITFQ